MKINKSFQSRFDNGWLHIGSLEIMADWLHINFIGELVAVSGG